MFLVFFPGTSDPSRRPGPPPPPRPLRDRPRAGRGGGRPGLLRPGDSEEDRQGETHVDDAVGSFGKIRESALEKCVQDHVWHQQEESAAVIGLDIPKNQHFNIYI